MTINEVRLELAQIRLIESRDREEAEERKEALKERLYAFIAANNIRGVFRETLERQVDL